MFLEGHRDANWLCPIHEKWPKPVTDASIKVEEVKKEKVTKVDAEINVGSKVGIVVKEESVMLLPNETKDLNGKWINWNDLRR